MSDKGKDKNDGNLPKRRQFGAPDGNPINRGGRPKGSKNTKTEFGIFMRDKLSGNKNLSTRQALWMTLRHQALVEKDPRVLIKLIEMDARFFPEIYTQNVTGPHANKIAELEEALAKEKARKGGGVLVVSGTQTLEKFRIEAEEQRQIMLRDQAEAMRRWEAGEDIY
ncbi:MAG: hypothetical protein ACK4PK_09900 [Alphaproteobacteria bacterium]